VNLNATVTTAPTPSQFQRSGAIISVGGRTLATNTYQYCGTLAAVESILSAAGNYAELTNMATPFFAQGGGVGLYILELGVGTSADAEIADLATWITNNPGVFYSYLAPASWDYSKDEVGSIQITLGGSGYTSAPTVTISAPTSGTTATATASITNGVVTSVTITNPGSGYTAAPTVTFSAPTSGTTATGTATLASAMNILAGDYSSPSGKTYFFVTTTTTNLPNYTGVKSIFAMVPSPTATSSEFQTATAFYQWLNNNPGPANQLAPMAFRYVYGVTPWAPTGNSASITTVLSNYGNLVYTGAEGGISTACLFKGTTMDGTQSAWWYGVDWFQIQVEQALAAAIINGSNSNPPLIYDQAGINTLLSVAQGIANNAVSYGCALSATVTAVPFYTYITENPSNYAAGIYNGFSATVVGPSGYLTITFNLDAVQFVA
ncbi:MAG: hypothetical protein G3I10_01275, partial [Ferrovum sp.]|nr:hypothetical protein [Ferrovum sp.]